MLNRKKFIRTAITISAGTLFFPLYAQEKKEPKPRMADELVRTFVGKAHRDMSIVRQMMEENPALLNCAWDWGGGDFETALGAASHVGYIELVEYLISHGAQMNFLTLCLWGKTEMVVSMLNAYPALLHMRGPHGFTALHHAMEGGEAAAEIKDLLMAKGLTERKRQ